MLLKQIYNHNIFIITVNVSPAWIKANISSLNQSISLLFSWIDCACDWKYI